MPRTLRLKTWEDIQSSIMSCNRCPRLRRHCTSIGQSKRAAYRNDNYWARPVPNLGSPTARLLILGLAPGAHGANRTGRMFTGDKSGDFLFAAMHAEGFANQPTSIHRDDALQLIDCAITAAAHCAPPGNKPYPNELANCRLHLHRTINAMPAIHSGAGGILVLGKIAFDTALAFYKSQRWLTPADPRPRFAHGAFFRFSRGPFLLCTYHPSQQNTFTRKLTQPMLRAVFQTAKQELRISGCHLNP